MHAKRLILTTDEQGRLTQLPTLPSNTTVEVIILMEEPASASAPVKRRNEPPPSIAGKGKIVGDIMSPAAPTEDWDALK